MALLNNYMRVDSKNTYTQAAIPTHNTAFPFGLASGFIATSTISENVTFTLNDDSTIVFPAVPAGTYNIAVKKLAAATSSNSVKFVVFK